MMVAMCVMCVNPVFVDSQVQQLGRLWPAIWQVESSQCLDPPAGDGGSAVGPFQIRPGVILDVNRRCETSYVLADRHDLSKSIELFVLYCWLYEPEGGPEAWSRLWNGGPQWRNKPATKAYWRKVQEAMK